MTNLRTWEERTACGHLFEAGMEMELPASPHGHALPGDQPVWPRDRVVDVLNVRLEVAVDHAARSVTDTATRFEPSNEGLSRVAFDTIDLSIAAVFSQ